MLRGQIGRLLDIDHLIAAALGNGLWMLLLDILRHQADVPLGLSLIAEAIDRLSVVGLAYLRYAFLQSFVRSCIARHEHAGTAEQRSERADALRQPTGWRPRCT